MATQGTEVQRTKVELMFPDLQELDDGTIDGMLKDIRENNTCPCCKVPQIDLRRIKFARTETNRLVAACDQFQQYLTATYRQFASPEEIRPAVEKQKRLNDVSREKARRTLSAILGKPEAELAKEQVKANALIWRNVLTA